MRLQRVVARQVAALGVGGVERVELAVEAGAVRRRLRMTAGAGEVAVGAVGGGHGDDRRGRDGSVQMSETGVVALGEQARSDGGMGAPVLGLEGEHVAPRGHRRRRAAQLVDELRAAARIRDVEPARRRARVEPRELLALARRCGVAL